jgi:hypothetical protein
VTATDKPNCCGEVSSTTAAMQASSRRPRQSRWTGSIFRPWATVGNRVEDE